MVKHGFYKRITRLGSGLNGWSVLVLLIALFLLGPFLAILYETTGDSGGLWAHLLSTVFPRYVSNTLILMLGVSILSLFFGLSSAWLVARVTFPGDKIFEWLLIIPATVPAYLIAYTYTDFLEFAGPVQAFLRDLFGWQTARDYWFPEIRSMGGAILVMSSVLYPYVYLMARTAFRVTPVSLHDAARLHKPASLILLDLGLARPAIIAGLALVLMEVVSDFGTVEYFAIETLTLGIFNVWLGMNNLTAAAQIAGLSFIFILGLLFIELKARSRQRYFDTTLRANQAKKIRTRVPVTVLLQFVLEGYSVTDLNNLVLSGLNSLSVALAAAICVMVISVIMVVVVTHKKHRILKMITAISAMGYAFPGVVLAIGIVSFAGVVAAGIDNFLRRVFGQQSSGILVGGIGLLIFAYVVRFEAIGYGAVTSGISRVSPDIINANHLMGRRFTNSLVVLTPILLRKSIITGGLLVFVDVMKELPITLILRPFNYETLATYVYQFAKDELLEEAALAGLVIVIVGLGPVLWMNAWQRR